MTLPHVERLGDVTDEEIRALLAAGQNGATIECSVIGGAAGFDLTASLALDALALRVEAGELPATTTTMRPASGNVSYRSEQTANVAYASPPNQPCRLWMVNAQHVAPGRAWFQLECPVVVSDDGGSSCALGTSTVVVQNCSQ